MEDLLLLLSCYRIYLIYIYQSFIRNRMNAEEESVFQKIATVLLQHYE